MKLSPDAGTYKLISPMFSEIGDATNIQLGKIIPENFGLASGDNIQFFDSTSGGTDWSATYFEMFGGWVEMDSNTFQKVNDFEIDTGTGFFALVSNVGASLTVAGEVRTEGIDVEIGSGYTIVGNPLPIPITLGDIIPSENFSIATGCNIQFFNAISGATEWTATYFTEFGGWVEMDSGFFQSKNLEPLDPGDGMFVLVPTGIGTVTLSFPEIKIKD